MYQTNPCNKVCLKQRIAVVTFCFHCTFTEPERKAYLQSPERARRTQRLPAWYPRKLLLPLLIRAPPSNHPISPPFVPLPPPNHPTPTSAQTCPALTLTVQPTHLHQPPGLADDCILQAIQGEAINFLQDPDRGLSDLLHQGMGPVHCRRGCLWVWDQLNQRDMIRWIYLMRETGGQSQQAAGVLQDHRRELSDVHTQCPWRNPTGLTRFS